MSVAQRVSYNSTIYYNTFNVPLVKNKTVKYTFLNRCVNLFLGYESEIIVFMSKQR